MRTAALTTVLALAVSAGPAAASTGAAAKNPTRVQIRSAVAQAESSKLLWATVNICNSRRYRDTLGIRGQMPSLGFPAWLSMKIQLSYYSSKRKRFVEVPKGGAMTVRLGRSSTGLQQDGWSVSFKPPVLLEATVQFVWRRSGLLLGETKRVTTAGHPNADFGSPPRYSAARCRIR